MLNEQRARTFATLIAAVAWIGLAMQMYLLVSSFVADGKGALAGVWRFFAFFTLLTNILVACVITGFAVGGRWKPGPQLLTATTLFIAIVGLVYHFILSATWSPEGMFFIADKINHYATPILTVLFWLSCVPKGAHKWADVLGWLVYPTGYLVYMLARGALDGFYPYFFIDPSKLGWAAFAVNAVGMCAFFAAAGLVFVAIDKGMGAPRRAPA